MSTENVNPKCGINAREISQADTQSHPSSDILTSPAEGPRTSLHEEHIQAEGNSPTRSLRDVAALYHQMGFNVIPLGADKAPVEDPRTGRPLSWTRWQNKRQSKEGLKSLPWEGAEGLAAITGEVSGGLACIDFDKQANRSGVDALLAKLALPADYPWVVKTHGGYHVWALCPGLKLTESGKGSEDRDGVDGGHIELRYERHCATLPPSRHPKGVRYEFIAGELPSDAPATVSPEALLVAYDAVTKTEAGPIAVSGQVKAARKTARKPGEPEEAYARAAFERELANVRNATEGHRNGQLNKSAFALGQLVAGGYLDRAEVEAQLTEAALASGLTEAETRATLRSGLEAGMVEPRTIPASAANAGVPRSVSGTNDSGSRNGGQPPIDDEGVSEDLPRPASWPYAIDIMGRMVHQKVDARSGDVIVTPIADFHAGIARQIIDEDGVRSFQLEGETCFGTPFSTSIPAAEMEDVNRLKSKLSAEIDPRAAIYPNMAPHLASAIRKLTDHTDTTRRYARTGWLGRQTFLIPGREPDGVQISLNPKLPYRIDPQADIDEGLVALEHLIRSVGPENSLPALVMLFQAPMGHLARWRNERYALFIQGRTGMFKTSWTQAGLAIYGAEFADDDRFLLKWGEGATPNAIMAYAAQACDSSAD